MKLLKTRILVLVLVFSMFIGAGVLPVYAEEVETESAVEEMQEFTVEEVEQPVTEESQLEIEQVEQTESSYLASTNFVMDVWFTSSTKETDVVTYGSPSTKIYIWYSIYDSNTGKAYSQFQQISSNHKIELRIKDSTNALLKNDFGRGANKNFFEYTPNKIDEYTVEITFRDQYSKIIASNTVTLLVIESYSVKFNANGGTNPPEAQSKRSDQTLTLTTEVPEKSFTVTYNANGGTVSESTKTVNCQFKEWNTSASGSGTSYASGGSFDKNINTTLYAIWTNPKAGTLITPKRDGYTFDGWYTSLSGGTEVTSETVITRNQTVYAHWSKVGSSYKIEYNGNGGSGAPAATTKKEGVSVTLSTVKPTKSFTLTYDANGGKVSPAKTVVNCTFKNWNTKADGSGTSYTSGARYTSNASATLYAQWTNPKAGTLASPTRDKYDFVGWYTAKTGGSKVAADTVITKNMTVYARWEEKGEDYGNTAKGFVYRLYKLVLGRNPDKAGLEDWTSQLTSGKSTGAEVANGFIYSVELANRKLSNADYVDMLYATFLNRKADSAGRAYWVNYLEKGMSRAWVYRGFANSAEFNKICTEYGIKAGSVVLTEPKDQNEGVTMFVYRCYEKFLGRKPDDAGLNDWCNRLLKGEINPKEAAYGFVMSSEFINKNLSNTDYIKTMYLGLFDRAADSGGLADWVGKLDEGNSRETIFYGFADSLEFRELARSFGLNGDWPGTPVHYVTGVKTFVDVLMNNKSKWQMSKSTGSGGYFEPGYSLIDLDLDGTPELVVTSLGGTMHNAPTKIYRVQNGTLTLISSSYAAGETGEIQNLSLYKNPSTGKYIYIDKEIVSSGSYGNSTLYVELYVNGNSVTSNVKFQEDYMSRTGSYEYRYNGGVVNKATYTNQYNSYFGSLVNAQLSYGKVSNAEWHKLTTNGQRDKLTEMYSQFSYK